MLGLIEISDKIARLSEAEYAFETKRRKLEHQFEVTVCGAAWAAVVTRAPRRSPLGPLGIVFPLVPKKPFTSTLI